MKNCIKGQYVIRQIECLNLLVIYFENCNTILTFRCPNICQWVGGGGLRPKLVV